ncbi:hypothetical protein OS493_027617 [Desmophyllum pertusum]|uniref:Uncharacterized protein n=1 Tax=Desmophyllum pertusum TaxID=174260 RepID=A0A9X0D1R0_9CNID|nr:hypothetical protein OS493_027617 [Desmophyllum pertusum]
MENMDIIFPGFLPSIVEEEENDEDSDTESSEKSQDTDFDSSVQYDKFNDLSNLPTVCKRLANDNGGLLESSVNTEYNYSETRAEIATFIESQESVTNNSKPNEERVVIRKPAENHSLDAFGNVYNNAANVKTVHEPVKTDQNDTNLLSRRSGNRPQVLDTENGKNILSSEPARYAATHESVIPTKYVADFTSGSFDISSDKENGNRNRTIVLS